MELEKQVTCKVIMNGFRWFIVAWLYVITLFVVYFTIEIRDLNNNALRKAKGYTYYYQRVTMPIGFAVDNNGEPITEYGMIGMKKKLK